MTGWAMACLSLIRFFSRLKGLVDAVQDNTARTASSGIVLITVSAIPLKRRISLLDNIYCNNF